MGHPHSWRVGLLVLSPWVPSTHFAVLPKAGGSIAFAKKKDPVRTVHASRRAAPLAQASVPALKGALCCCRGWGSAGRPHTGALAVSVHVSTCQAC